MIKKIRLATVWMDGCSGCHMSFLDTDERLLELAAHVDLVYSPLVDNKEFPSDVDVTLVEGSISSVEDLERIQHFRSRTKVLVSLGDCAVTANVPSMRNPFDVDCVLRRGYEENADTNRGAPKENVPALLPRSRPLHEIVKVDVFVPGCPPSADVIHYMLSELLAGRTPELSGQTHFGA
jgi:NAD-reducing hydrogenase small subunit